MFGTILIGWGFALHSAIFNFLDNLVLIGHNGVQITLVNMRILKFSLIFANISEYKRHKWAFFCTRRSSQFNEFYFNPLIINFFVAFYLL